MIESLQDKMCRCDKSPILAGQGTAADPFELEYANEVVLPSPNPSSYHWGQSLVFRPGTLQIHCKEMDNLLALILLGPCQFHSKCSLPVCLQFTDSVIFKDTHSVPEVSIMYFTLSTSRVSMLCTCAGHRNHFFPVHLECSCCGFPYQFPCPVN
jgi:hypothetical protein